MTLDLPRNLFNQRDVRELETTASKKISSKVTSEFSDTSSSSVFADLTGGTVTITGLDATKTYTILAFTTCQLRNPSNTKNGLQLFMDLVIKQITESSSFATTPTKNISLISVVKSLTGITSYTAKLQHRATSGTVTTTGSILIVALEE